MNDEKGKPIKDALINFDIIEHPITNPKERRKCLQIVGGSPNAHCTGIWTEFYPLVRPTEVEFEFTMNGKIDFQN